jgi:hypothetical protein
MNNDGFRVYLVKLPGDVRGAVRIDEEGFASIYINDDLSPKAKKPHSCTKYGISQETITRTQEIFGRLKEMASKDAIKARNKFEKSPLFLILLVIAAVVALFKWIFCI